MTWINLTEEEYHNLRQVSSSDLKLVAKSPAHYLAKKLSMDDEPTPSMRIGKLVHGVLLENKELIIRPQGRKDSKEVKEFYEKIDPKHHGSIVTSDEYDSIRRIVDAVHTHSVASQLLADATEREISGVTDSRKVRLDALTSSYIVDLKTCSDSNPSEFKYQFFKLFYHLQAAYYVDVAYEIDNIMREFYFITVSTSQPHNVVCYKVSQNTLDQGRKLYTECYQKLMEAQKSNNYAGYADDCILEI